MKVLKENYLKPEQRVLEMQPCELMVISVGNTNLDGDDEKIVVSEEPVEEGFWGR